MGTLISTLIIIVCILLILIVLVQNSKGGGLSSSFSSSNQIMGVRKTGDFLEKSTWILAGTLLLLCLASANFSKSGMNTEEAVSTESVTKKKAAEAPVMPAPQVQNNNVPSLPQQTPDNQKK